MMVSKSFRIARYLAPAAAVVIAACGGSDKSTGPGNGGVSSADRNALVALMGKPAVQSALAVGGGGFGAALLPMIGQNIQSIGTLEVSAGGAATLIAPNGARQSGLSVRTALATPTGTYRAFGGQFAITIKTDATHEEKMVWTGIIAVNNLNSPTDFITAAVLSLNSTTPPTSTPELSFSSSQSGDQFAMGSYVKLNGQEATAYQANSGKIALTNISFNGGSKNCPGTEQVPSIKVCKYTAGTIKGSFNFGAKQVGGDATVSIPATSVNVPATRMTVSVDATAY